MKLGFIFAIDVSESVVPGVGQVGGLGPPPAHVVDQEVLRAQDSNVLRLAGVLHAGPRPTCRLR